MSLAATGAPVDPKQVAETILGTIKWTNDHKGYCACPGEHQHSKKGSRTDCILYLDEVPTVFCFHRSCVAERQAVNYELRTAIRGGGAGTQDTRSKAEIKAYQREAAKRQLLELRTSHALPVILKKYSWPYAEIQASSPSELPKKSSANAWQDLIRLFAPGDTIWIGGTYDSGKEEHQICFRTREEWLAEVTVPPQFTCPSAFKNSSFSRSNENVLHRRFLVVESDVLSRDEVGAVFRWLRDEVGLNLKAVVDTAGKSLHAWFTYPSAKVVEELKVMLPCLGCDPGMFKPSQPARMPGAWRDNQFQRLVYLDRGEEVAQ